jgi:hypothetical protein
MVRMRSVLLACLLAGTAGCTVGPDSSYTDLQPLVFPNEGRLGGVGADGTSMMLIVDSNAMGTFFGSYDLFERNDLTEARISAVLRDPSTSASTPVSIREFFAAELAPTTAWYNVMTGGSTTVIVVDLPAVDALNTATPFPFTAILEVSIDGSLAFQPRVIISGAGGGPTELVSSTLQPGGIDWLLRPSGGLAVNRMVRIRPKRVPGTFAPGGPAIGGIELDVTYSDACYFEMFASSASDAASATAIASPPQAAGAGLLRSHVVLVDPAGFDLEFLSDISGQNTVDETLLGEGPILDLQIQDNGSSSCSLPLAASEFAFSNLRAVDTAGNSLFTVASATADTAAAPSASANLRLYLLDLPVTGCGLCE